MRRKRKSKRSNKTALTVLPVMSLSMMMLFGGNLVAHASTVDDVRELIGNERVDSQFSVTEQRRIQLEYTKIENHNRIAKMFMESKSIDLSSAAEKQRTELLASITKQKTDLVEKFSSGAFVDTVMSSKSRLDTLMFEGTKIRQNGTDFKMELLPNEWQSKYLEMQKNINTVQKSVDLGDIGENLESPVRGQFYITSPFGMRIHPVTGETSMHYGLDLAGQTGTDVLAAWNGVVLRVYESETGGKTVEIQHDTSLKTRYLHLSEILVTPGQKVSQYDVIGKVGATGRVTGPHLHFEVSLDDQPVNPVFFFGSKGVTALRWYIGSTRDVIDVTEMTALVEKIKNYPKKVMEEMNNPLKPEEKQLFSNKTGIVPANSIPVQLYRGFDAPKPSDVMTDIDNPTKLPDALKTAISKAGNSPK